MQLVKGETGMRLEVWRSRMKAGAYDAHKTMQASLETQMKANALAGVKHLRRVIANLVRGETGMRLEVWRSETRDAKRWLEMGRLQQQLDAQAADSNKGVALRQLRRTVMQLVKGEIGMRLDVWRSVMKVDLHALCLQRQERARRDETCGVALRQLRKTLGRIVKGEMAFRLAAWRVRLQQGSVTIPDGKEAKHSSQVTELRPNPRSLLQPEPDLAPTYLFNLTLTQAVAINVTSLSLSPSLRKAMRGLLASPYRSLSY